MRYTIARENEVKKLAAEGKTIEYISSVTGIPFKVIWGWCPELRPHDDVIKQSVKQRYHFIYPDFEAKISSAFSPFISEKISDEQWEDINKVIYETLFEESLYVFKNVLTDPPDFGDMRKLSDESFVDYMKKFWTKDSEYALSRGIAESYINMNYNSIHYWSSLKKKAVKDISKGDIEVIQEKLKCQGLSEARILSILKTGLIPLKYAFKNGQTLLKTYEYQLPKNIKRKVKLDQDTLIKVLNYNWKSPESYIANLIGCQTGMRLQEVLALTLEDIYTDGYINASHIWSKGEYLINPKSRLIKVSTTLIDCILKYTVTSPYKDFKPTDFVFYSINRTYPTGSSRNWSKDLKEVCSHFMEDVSHIEFSIWN